ncbi:hypothetical protein Syun_014336 [Stephania yunnanensis]|uniref:Uncharacterized protein n=1 Tax=Stephania yunnanensis TaxID=152371 RepID=A0AAP0JJ54_9MAGN
MMDDDINDIEGKRRCKSHWQLKMMPLSFLVCLARVKARPCSCQRNHAKGTCQGAEEPSKARLYSPCSCQDAVLLVPKESIKACPCRAKGCAKAQPRLRPGAVPRPPHPRCKGKEQMLLYDEDVVSHEEGQGEDDDSPSAPTLPTSNDLDDIGEGEEYI